MPREQGMVCEDTFFFLGNKGGYLLYREWCPDILLLSSSLSGNKHKTVKRVLLWYLGGGHRRGLSWELQLYPNCSLCSRREFEVPKTLLETRGDFIQGINWIRAILRVLPWCSGWWLMPPPKVSWDTLTVEQGVRARPEDGGSAEKDDTWFFCAFWQLGISIFILGLFKD